MFYLEQDLADFLVHSQITNILSFVNCTVSAQLLSPAGVA